MTPAPVFGDFLVSAGEHITAAISFRSELPDSAQGGAARQIGRLVATVSNYLADLPAAPGLAPGPGRDAGPPNVAAQLALGRAAHSLRQATPGMAGTDSADIHPAIAHLSAAAECLAAGRDLLQTHFATGPDGARAGTSYWAPLITSGPVTAALLGELATCLDSLGPWIAAQTPARRASPSRSSSAQRALRSAEPWLHLAVTAIHAAQQVHYPLPARSLLDAIPANAPPPRLPPAADEPVHDLCECIPLTAERLRYLTCDFAARARWSPAATSLSWRRDALASAIIAHASELILRALTERAAQLGLEPAFGARLHDAVTAMGRAWTSWRAVAGHWDIMTTGARRGTGLTPVAREIDDLVLRTGRLAYRNLRWTPACGDASLIRDPDGLACSAHDVTTVLAAVHHASDAISHIAADDHRAVLDAAACNRLYVPTRMLPDTYDIPQPYAPAPRAYTDALLIAYEAAAGAAAHITTALDDLATAINAPSSLLAAARRASTAAGRHRRGQDRLAVPRQHLVTPRPGRTEKALLNLRIRDPALLLRAAVIDQAARDLLTEAATKAHSRDSVTRRASRPAPGPPQSSARTAQIAGQDVPGVSQPSQLTATVPCCSGAQTGSPRRSTADSVTCVSRQSCYGSH
jgi:hypothetical protein